MATFGLILIAFGLALAVVFSYDILQREHAILHNFPLMGHLRYMLEAVGPELRQYIVTNNDEELPFSRDQRRWVYSSAKGQNNLFGFGTDNDVEGEDGYIIFNHATFPHVAVAKVDDARSPIPCAKILGGSRRRPKAFRPASIVNTSAMSFGSLSGAAVEAMNRGSALADCLQNTGEGGISPHHDHGGGLIWQIGTGYFGCRNLDGSFNMDMLKERVDRYDVRAIEVKLSQGAKPGKGGVLPGAKVTREIAAIRGVEVGKTVYSPSSHTAFGTADEMLDFIERIADETGLPVGIKSAVGQMDFWEELAELLESGNRAPDYIQVDGGEGGTGAAPLSFSDHVALPFKAGFARVYKTFARRGVHDDLIWIGSGKLGFPEQTLLAFALGCDLVAVGREAMMSIGCIQAQKCHTGECPVGVATQQKWLMRGLEPKRKAHRFANYITTLRHDVLELSHAMGVSHPAEVTLDHVELLDPPFGSRPARAVFGYEPGWGVPGRSDAGVR